MEYSSSAWNSIQSKYVGCDVLPTIIQYKQQSVSSKENG